MISKRVWIPPAIALGLFLQVHCVDQENPSFPPKGAGRGRDGGIDGPKIPPQPAQPHPNRNPQPKVVECPRAPLPAPPSGTCGVVTSGAGAVVLQGTVLAPQEVLHRGEVVVDAAGMIACAACDCSAVPGYAGASVVACADGVISPGLVNPHEHMTFQNNGPVPHGTQRYENRSDWQGARGHTRLEYKSGANQIVQTYGELRFLMSGTTTMAGGGGAAGLVRNVDASLEKLEGLPIQLADSDVFPLGTPGKNIAAGCDYTEPRPSSRVAVLESYLPHISEGIDAEAHNEFTCLSEGEHDLIERQTGIIHGVALTPDDAALVRSEMAKVVWSPRSNVDLYGNTASVVMLDMAGVALALGTDWVPSGSMNMLRELHCADSLNKIYFDGHFSDADLWRMATMNGALAVGAGHAIGMLKTGYLADIAIYDGKKSKDFRAVLDAGVEDVALVLRGGRALYGDTALIQDAAFGGGAGCEAFPVPVCGRAKSVCLDARTSDTCVATCSAAGTVCKDGYCTRTLGVILATGEPFYPLFFCRDETPRSEPSCVPLRSESVAGSGIYSGEVAEGDSDGDGIPDGDDDCPRVFNPVRPMDRGAQADADEDGIGDACDPCPNDPNQECVGYTASDRDNDGIPDGVDTCPEVSDPTQPDKDGDGWGDACDSCESPNPGATPCALPISTLRNPGAPGHPASGTVVVTQGYVSARRTGNLLYIQEATTGAPWQGIYVLADALTGTASGTGAGPRLGQQISVTGLYKERFFVDEIWAARVTIDNAALQTMTPLVLTAGQLTAGGAAAEPYESLLVQLDGPFTITDGNPDSGPFYEFVVNGQFRVDDFVNPRHGADAKCGGVVCSYPPCFPASATCEVPQDDARKDFTLGATFTSLTGIAGYSFGNRKLYPRFNTSTANDYPRP
jgi:cytosine/adenosine deaminase-related metal-dependent hydrolase